MTPREELEALRRLAELEAKARGQAKREPAPDPSKGGGTLSIGPFDTKIKTSEGVDRFLSGVGKGMSDLVLGARQMLGNAPQADVDAVKRRDAPLMDTTAGSVGNVAGKIAVGLPAAFIPGANTLAGAAVIGGAQGLLEPTATGESTLQNVALGAAGGAGGVLAGRALAAGYQGAKGLVEPFVQGGQQKIAGRVLNRFAADPAALAAAKGGKTATGASPTLAEATKDPGIAALQRALEQQDPQIAAALASRYAENNAARVGVLQDLAGDQAKRAAAVAARDDAAGEMYRAATQANYTVDSKLAELLQRPVVKQAMQRAEALAKNQGRPFAFDVTPSNPFSGVGISTNNSRQITGQGLQDLKMALDEMLSDPASGFTGKAGDAVKSLRGQIVDWMEKANPDFKAARQAYAAQSRPINQMDVGERLLEKTTGAIRDMGGNPRLQANSFARALNDEQGLVRKATGFKGVNAIADVLDADQIRALNAVRGELELGANLASAANGAGSQTAKSLASQNLLRQLIGPTGMPQSWAESAMLQTALRPVQFAMQAAEPKIQNQLLEAFLNPAKAQQLIKAAEVKALDPRLAQFIPLLQQAATQSVPAAAVSR